MYQLASLDFPAANPIAPRSGKIHWICHRSLVGPPLSSACRFKGGTWQQPQYWFKQRRIVCHGKRGKCNPCHYSWRISASCREEKLVANKYQKHLRVAGKISTGGVLNIGFVDVSCYKQGIPTAPNEGHPVFWCQNRKVRLPCSQRIGPPRLTHLKNRSVPPGMHRRKLERLRLWILIWDKCTIDGCDGDLRTSCVIWYQDKVMN